MIKINKFLKKLFGPKKKVAKPQVKDYDGDYLFLDLTEGGNFRNLRFRHFSGQAITGDIPKPTKNFPVGFYLKVVGLVDLKEPTRSWGMNHGEFVNKCLK